MQRPRKSAMSAKGSLPNATQRSLLSSEIEKLEGQLKKLRGARELLIEQEQQLSERIRELQEEKAVKELRLMGVQYEG